MIGQGRQTPISKSPLIMVHGLLGPLHMLNVDRHFRGREVLCPDLLGYSARPLPPSLSLDAQAEEVARLIRGLGRRCHLLGHSVGGAVVMWAAHKAPECVQSLITVEGNFTLDDAFMCRRIAPLPAKEWARQWQLTQQDAAAWLTQAGIAVTEDRLRMARIILGHQSAETVQAMARAVVHETANPRYLKIIHQVLDGGTPLHLLAGERSAKGWHVPPWVRAYAHSDRVMPGCGHMMMLEDPARFCEILSEILAGSD